MGVWKMSLTIEKLLELGEKLNTVELATEIKPTEETEGDINMGKRQLLIQLEKIKDVKDFVAKTSNYASDMYVKCGNFVVDAKSLMGILSLDLEKPFSLNVDSANFVEIENDFKDWIVNND